MSDPTGPQGPPDTSWAAPGAETPWDPPRQWSAPPTVGYGPGAVPPAGSPSTGGPTAGGPTPPGPTPPGVPGVPPVFRRAAQPGVVPLRPLVLGDLFDGTFRSVRANPTVMFGFAVAVMALVSLVSAFLQWFSVRGISLSVQDPQAAITDDLDLLASQIAEVLTGVAGTAVLTLLATVLVTGILALSVADAVLGRVTSLGEAWERVRPRLGGLVVVTLLVGLLTVVVFTLVAGAFSVPLVLALTGGGGPGWVSVLVAVLGVLLALLATAWISVRLLFGPTALVLEGIGPVAALRRSLTLTRGSFWRVLGRMLLITLLTSTAAAFLGGALGAVGGLVALVANPAVGTAVTGFLSGAVSGFVVPITAAFETLMYMDERMRREDLATALERAAAS